MTKEDHIKYWTSSSEKDWEVMNDLFQLKRYVHCLFFAHLVLEKLCKAHWVKDNESNYPPRIHNLVKIISQTKNQLPEADIIFLADINKFQLEGRYPDYISNIYTITSRNVTQQYLTKTNNLRTCLTEKLL